MHLAGGHRRYSAEPKGLIYFCPMQIIPPDIVTKLIPHNFHLMQEKPKRK